MIEDQAPYRADPKITGLLLDCLHLDKSRISADRLRSWAGGEWNALLGFAEKQRVGGFLARRLEELDLRGAVPVQVATELKNIRLKNIVRYLTLRNQLREVANAFRAADIPVIVLKGMHLTEVIPGYQSVREMGDIDLLVPRAALRKAADIMSVQGYKPLSPVSLDLGTALPHHIPRFLNFNTAVEIHWNITEPEQIYSIDPEELWKRAAPIRAGDDSLLGLSFEDLVLHLCLHMSYQHLFNFGLRPLCDIAEVIARFGHALAWKDLTERANRWKWNRGTYVSLRLAKDMVGAAVPEEALEAMRLSSFDEKIRWMAQSQILSDKTTAITPRLSALWLNRRWTGKIAVFLQTLFLPKNFMARAYNVPAASIRIYLCYLTRFVRLWRFHWRTVLRLHQNDRFLAPASKRLYDLDRWLNGGPS